MLKMLATAAALAWSLLAGSTAQAAEVTFYNSYLSPPFVVGEGGLAADLTAYFNKKLAGKYEIKLLNVQRARLNFATLDKGDFSGAVLFQNPMFVGDEPKQRFLWTDTLMKDGNVVVSAANRKFNFQGPQSFDGKVFLAVAGNRYAGLEERIGKTVERVDGTSEERNLRKLVEGTGDATVMARSIALYLAKQPGLEGKVVIDEKPYSSFTRHIMVARSNPDLAEALNHVVKEMASDPEWKAILAKYQL